MSFCRNKFPNVHHQTERIVTKILSQIVDKAMSSIIPKKIILQASLSDTIYFEDLIANLDKVNPCQKQQRLSEIEDSKVQSLTLKVKKQSKKNLEANKSKICLSNISSLESKNRTYRKISQRKEKQKFLIKLEEDASQALMQKQAAEKIKEPSFLYYYAINNLFSFLLDNSEEDFQRLLRLKKIQNENELKEKIMKSMRFSTSEERTNKQKKESLQKRSIEVFTTDYNGQPLPYQKKSCSAHTPATLIDVSFNILQENTEKVTKTKNQFQQKKIPQDQLKFCKFQKLNLVESTNCFDKNKQFRNLSLTEDKLGEKKFCQKKMIIVNNDGKKLHQPQKLSFQALNRLKNCQKFLKNENKQQPPLKKPRKILEKKSKIVPFETREKRQKSILINPIKFYTQKLSINHPKSTQSTEQSPSKINSTPQSRFKKHKVSFNQSALFQLAGQRENTNQLL